MVVDDFESYNDIESGQEGSRLIYEIWIDGFDDPNNGSIVGPPVAFGPWWSPDAHGGSQSMPYMYDNSGPANYSEITANTANLAIDQDWTRNGIQTLSLWFLGDLDNAFAHGHSYPHPNIYPHANLSGSS